MKVSKTSVHKIAMDGISIFMPENSSRSRFEWRKSRMKTNPSAFPPSSPVPRQLTGVFGSRKLRLKSIILDRNELFDALFMINFLAFLYPTTLLAGTCHPLDCHQINRISQGYFACQSKVTEINID